MERTSIKGIPLPAGDRGSHSPPQSDQGVPASNPSFTYLWRLQLAVWQIQQIQQTSSSQPTSDIHSSGAPDDTMTYNGRRTDTRRTAIQGPSCHPDRTERQWRRESERGRTPERNARDEVSLHPDYWRKPRIVNTNWTPTGLPGLFDPKLHELHLTDDHQTLGVKLCRPNSAILHQPLPPLYAHEKHIASSSGQPIPKDADTQHGPFPFQDRDRCRSNRKGNRRSRSPSPRHTRTSPSPSKTCSRGRDPKRAKSRRPSEKQSPRERSPRSTASPLQITRVPIGDQDSPSLPQETAMVIMELADKALAAMNSILAAAEVASTRIATPRHVLVEERVAKDPIKARERPSTWSMAPSLLDQQAINTADAVSNHLAGYVTRQKLHEFACIHGFGVQLLMGGRT